MPIKPVSKKYIINKYPCWIEERQLCYRDKNEVEYCVELSKDEFALWELGFVNGHKMGVEYSLSTVSELPQLDIKRLRKIYG